MLSSLSNGEPGFRQFDLKYSGSYSPLIIKELKQATTTKATRTSLNKGFDKQNDGRLQFTKNLGKFLLGIFAVWEERVPFVTSSIRRSPGRLKVWNW